MRGYQRTSWKVLFGHMDSTGRRGNSHKQWVDHVREDLQMNDADRISIAASQKIQRLRTIPLIALYCGVTGGRP